MGSGSPGGTAPESGRTRAHESGDRSFRRAAPRGRKPTLLLRLPASLLLRLAARQLSALLFQLPPRFTRFEEAKCSFSRTACSLWVDRPAHRCTQARFGGSMLESTKRRRRRASVPP